MKKFLTFICALAVCLPMLADGHFIADAAYRQHMESTFNKRMSVIGQKFFATADLQVNTTEREALEFLYAYMPLADVTDYPTAFFLANVRTSLQAKQEMTWGSTVPELLFHHFVVPIRVNNEALDASRMEFYKELKQRVKGLSMHDAILEVNHWCHEKVTYQPADARTSSPLATVRTATGRCGEQSTFTVAALRAIGIPARQVYTPRWAHTDDNHAWVEAWADGTWYFLGACEPEPVLNLGWFNAPASRGMLMHTRAFGDYNGPEEVMLRTANFTEINLTANYAPVATAHIQVVDAKGTPVDGAKVEFKIYNYAEFYTAVTKYTDQEGRTSLSAGRGDLLVWASKDGAYGYRKVSFGHDDNVTLQLSRSASADAQLAEVYTEALDIVPPPENVTLPEVTDQQREANQVRFAYEDSVRRAYTATFPTTESAKRDYPQWADYVVKSRGNSKVITDFINRHQDNPERVKALFDCLTDKDFRDMPTEILEDNFTAQSNQVSPRVEDEMVIIPFKHYFQKAFTAKQQKAFKADPTKLIEWIDQNISLYPEENTQHIAQTPVGVMESKATDSRSRDIFFVDVARSLGIEAQKDAVTGKVQYMKNGQWQDVSFGTAVQTQAPTGQLMLSYQPDDAVADPKYYTHFTISKLENGCTQLLNLEEGQADMGNGTSWSNTFKNGYTLDEGTYLLTTGSRMASGSVLVTNKIFRISQGKTTELSLDIRQNTNDVSVIGSFNSESLVSKDGKDVSVLSLTGRGYYVLGLIGVGQEPTNHALHDIEKLKADFEKWGRPMVLLFESETAARKFSHEEFAQLPSNTIFAIDKDGSIRKQIVREMKLQNAHQLPIIIIADTFNRVVFITQGYTIGAGEQLHGVIKKLQ